MGLQTATGDPLGDAAFAQYYRDKIQPRCAAVERHRQRAAAQLKSRLMMAVLPALIIPLLGFLAVSGWNWDAQVALFGFGSLELFLVVWVLAPKRAFERDVKTAIWPIVLAFFGPDFRYYSAKRSPAKARLFKDAGILPSDGTWTLGERVSGSYRGVGLDLDELTVKVERRKRTETVFKGLVISLNLRRSMRARTIVRRDTGIVGNLGTRLSTPLSRVRLEDPKFERIFEVYGSDQIEARVLLTPGFMERLRRLSDHHGGKLQCSFYAGWLQVYISSGHDYFEIRSGLSEPVNLGEDVAALRQEMQMIFDLIEELRLHERRGL